MLSFVKQTRSVVYSSFSIPRMLHYILLRRITVSENVNAILRMLYRHNESIPHQPTCHC